MTLVPTPMAAPLGGVEAPAPGGSRPEMVEAVIPSGNLLQGRSTVAIEHQGTQYFLRATRAGKLILTK